MFSEAWTVTSCCFCCFLVADSFLKMAVVVAALAHVFNQSPYTNVTQGSSCAGSVPTLKQEIKKSLKPALEELQYKRYNSCGAEHNKKGGS